MVEGRSSDESSSLDGAWHDGDGPQWRRCQCCTAKGVAAVVSVVEEEHEGADSDSSELKDYVVPFLLRFWVFSTSLVAW